MYNFPTASGVCPGCGRCNTCGRSGSGPTWGHDPFPAYYGTVPAGVAGIADNPGSIKACAEKSEMCGNITPEGKMSESQNYHN